jgi:hypothetical protein
MANIFKNKVVAEPRAEALRVEVEFTFSPAIAAPDAGNGSISGTLKGNDWPTVRLGQVNDRAASRAAGPSVLYVQPFARIQAASFTRASTGSGERSRCTSDRTAFGSQPGGYQ